MPAGAFFAVTDIDSNGVVSCTIIMYQPLGADNAAIVSGINLKLSSASTLAAISSWWPVLASRSVMVDGQKMEKGPNPGVGFSTAPRASTRRSQGALGWEMSLGFPPNSYWLRGIVVEKGRDFDESSAAMEIFPRCVLLTNR